MTKDVEEYIQKVVDAAPPLTPYQRDRIAVLFRPVKVEGTTALVGEIAFEDLAEVLND